MPKSNTRRNLARFLRTCSALSSSRRLFALSLLLLTFLYPGQNLFQTRPLKPGPIRVLTSPILGAADYPLGDSTALPPHSARALVIQDIGSKTFLTAINPNLSLMPASTTKLMTALVAVETYQLDEAVTVRAANRAIGHTMELVPGEILTVRSLLYGLLIESGNDAALALADHHPAGYQGFVEEMNRKARQLGMTGTSYRNPSGVESYNHYTTARDLAVLAGVISEHPLLSEITSTKQTTVTDLSGRLVHQLFNTNLLLGTLEGVRGLKTGWTENSGECLVTFVEREGRGVIIVVLGSGDRFGDTAKFIDWVYSHHSWVKPD